MTTLTILIYIIGAIISWIIFYYVIKAAVRNGIIEARSDKNIKNFTANTTPEKPVNTEQMRLQQRYDKGEIQFEEFKSQWNKLNTQTHIQLSMTQGILLLIIVVVISIFNRWQFEKKRKHRRDYYRNDYLKSDAWSRKRYVVLKRDNWKCVFCGGNATQVHHKKYAKINIGKEPIEWLVSVCKKCHDEQHQ